MASSTGMLSATTLTVSVLGYGCASPIAVLLWHHLEPTLEGVKAGWPFGMRRGMRQVRFSSAIFALLAGVSAARAEPVCDAPTEEGYRVELSMEITGVTEGEPYRSGPDWIVERTTTVLPLRSNCTPVGSYTGPCPPK